MGWLKVNPPILFNIDCDTQIISKSIKVDKVTKPIESTPLARIHPTLRHYCPTATLLNDENSIIKNSNLENFNVENSNVENLIIEDKPASLAVEAAVAIVINGIHYAVLMASPHQLEYLAIGFLYSEGLIEHSFELLDWEVMQLSDEAKLNAFTQDNAINSKNDNDDHSELNSFEHLLDYDTYVIELTLSQRCHQRIQAQKRMLAGRTGCGMCGITGITQALPDLSFYLQHNQKNIDISQPSLDELLAIRAQIDATQHTHKLTGAVHAAATMQGNTLHLFEDVGRHNALDKLIGWQLRHKAEVHCVVMTSRLSIELVQKSIRMRLPWLVGMSAPTSTAVRVAERYGLGLGGFLRDNRVTFYTEY